MRFAVIEIGSTNTKAYVYDGKNVISLGRIFIEFKNNYKKEHKIIEADKEKLFKFIKSIKEDKIYVFGTSIFRNLNDSEKKVWLAEFYQKTNLDFHIVTNDMENELTVYGAIVNNTYPGKIAVMIGGGGSTELAILEKGKIIEKANSSFGAMDVTDMYPDLKNDIVTSDYKEILNRVKSLVNMPHNKADILILAGGDYLYYYDTLGYKVPKNKFYQDKMQPYAIDIPLMDKIDNDFYYHISLQKIMNEASDPNWWLGARGMRFCVKALTDILESKYIIPTCITMVYGIVAKIKNNPDYFS